jgi:tyrosinase
VIIRKNVTALTPSERARYVRGVKALKASGRYRWYVTAHVAAFTNVPMQAHMRSTFLPWHRQFLLQFEQDLQQVLDDATFALPYWDWSSDQATLTDPGAASVWQPDFMGGNGQPVSAGPFVPSEWQTDIYRSPQTGKPELWRRFPQPPTALPLPTWQSVSDCLSISDYDSPKWDTAVPSPTSFRNTLEGWVPPSPAGGLHNLVHAWVGGLSAPAGTMATRPSPDDPVFWLHHANVDRLWTAWQSRNGSSQSYLPETGGGPGINLNDPLAPWNSGDTVVTSADMLDHIKLGYRYDTEADIVTVGVRKCPGSVLTMAAPLGPIVLRKYVAGDTAQRWSMPFTYSPDIVGKAHCGYLLVNAQSGDALRWPAQSGPLEVEAPPAFGDRYGLGFVCWLDYADSDSRETYFAINNYQRTLVCDLTGGSCADETPIIAHPWKENLNQEWSISITGP